MSEKYTFRIFASVTGVFLRQCDHRRPVEVLKLVQPQGRWVRHELLDQRTRISGC